MSYELSSKLHLLAQLATGQRALADVAVDQWQELVAAASSQGLVPMLGWQAQKQQFDFPEQAAVEVKRFVIGSQLKHSLFEDEQFRIQHTLQDAGIPCIWLKGSALASLLYERTYLRPMVDLDLLVSSEHRVEALQLLRQLDYTEPHARLEAYQKQLHHYDLYGGPSNLVMVELHFALLGYEHDELLPPHHLAWFLRQTQTVEHQAGWSLTTFKTEAHLLYLCAHIMLQHGENEIDLLHLLDIHLMIEQHELNWDALVSKAIELRWAYAVERTLELTAHYFDTTVPDEVLVELETRRHEQDFVKQVKRFQNNKESNLLTHLSMLFGSTTPKEFVLLTKELLFPSAIYMRSRYQIPENQAVWTYYPRRWLDQLRRLVLAFLAKK